MQFNLVEHMHWVFLIYGAYYGMCTAELVRYFLTTSYISFSWWDDFFAVPIIFVPLFVMLGMLALLLGNPAWDVIGSFWWFLLAFFGALVAVLVIFVALFLISAFSIRRQERAREAEQSKS